jgi:hypothetical protein
MVTISSDSPLQVCNYLGICRLKTKGKLQTNQLISMEIDLKGEPLSCETIQKTRSAKISLTYHCHVQLI